MIYLELFLSFFKIGLFTFGGGYAMIPLVEEVALGFGLAPEQILNFIAVAESTPGPIAVNMATFVGASQAGILGSLVATLGLSLAAARGGSSLAVVPGLLVAVVSPVRDHELQSAGSGVVAHGLLCDM